jgi:hypothetical protein
MEGTLGGWRLAPGGVGSGGGGEDTWMGEALRVEVADGEGGASWLVS